jgi:hypothetical protein
LPSSLRRRSQGAACRQLVELRLVRGAGVDAHLGPCRLDRALGGGDGLLDLGYLGQLGPVLRLQGARRYQVVAALRPAAELLGHLGYGRGDLRTSRAKNWLCSSGFMARRCVRLVRSIKLELGPALGDFGLGLGLPDRLPRPRKPRTSSLKTNRNARPP